MSDTISITWLLIGTLVGNACVLTYRIRRIARAIDDVNAQRDIDIDVTRMDINALSADIRVLAMRLKRIEQGKGEEVSP